MRVLLTGATGFVGRALAPRLAASGHEVVAVVRGASALPAPVRWDLGRGAAPRDLPSRVEAVVHAAQSRNYRAFPQDGPELFAVNVAGTAALLDYAVRAGASRFCLLSTGSVYEPFRSGLDEEARLAPTSMLGASKLAAEVVARPYAALFALSILRVFTPYGPGQTGRLIPDLINRVRTGQAVDLSSDGQGVRLAPIFVDDLCAVVVAAVEGAWNATLNVASPRAASLREVAELIGRNCDRTPVFKVGTGARTDLAPPVERLGRLFDLDAMLPLGAGLALASRSARTDAAPRPPADRPTGREPSPPGSPRS